MRKIIDKASLFCSQYQIREMNGIKTNMVYPRARSVLYGLQDLERETLKSYEELIKVLHDPILKYYPFYEFFGEVPRKLKFIGINEKRKEAISIQDTDTCFIKDFDSISNNGYVAFYESYYNTSGFWHNRGFYSDSKFGAMSLALDYFFENFGNEISQRGLGNKSHFLGQFDNNDLFSTYVSVNSITITIFKIVSIR